MRTHILFTAMVAAQLVAALPLAAQQRANVGDKVPDVKFPDFQNSDGRQKLSDFYGQVVMVELWGTH